jgi:hypothetical protein
MKLDRAVMCRVTGGRTTGAMEDGTRTRQPTHTVGGVFVHRSEGLDIDRQSDPAGRISRSGRTCPKYFLSLFSKLGYSLD